MQNILGGYSGLHAGPASGGNGSLGAAFPTGFGASQTRRTSPRYSLFDLVMDRFAPCPWSATAGSVAPLHMPNMPTTGARQPLYTAEERHRRDTTAWTMVQGVLAPVQFAVFLVSLALVLYYLVTGHGYEVATASIVVKTATLYVIMLTGAIWEKKVFDKYLFAPAFLWEDVFSMLVITLHTLYLAELILGNGSARSLMLLALAAYASYLINATQFVLKLRAARLDAAGAGA